MSPRFLLRPLLSLRQSTDKSDVPLTDRTALGHSVSVGLGFRMNREWCQIVYIPLGWEEGGSSLLLHMRIRTTPHRTL